MVNIGYKLILHIRYDIGNGLFRTAGITPLLILSVMMCFSVSVEAGTLTAASCSQSHVTSALASANAGDIIQVPAGTCSWSGLSINKAVHLKGAGIGQTNITLAGNNTMSKQAAGIVRVSGFSFSKSGGGNESKGMTIDGAWLNTEPVIIENNSFTISSTGLLRINVAGGIIIANNTFTGGWDDSFIQPANPQDGGQSWGMADTMGMRDIDGKRNLYVEGNTFTGGTNQGIDCDAASRCVYRHNNLMYSSFNSHGLDTSAEGLRHWEVYSNNFGYVPTEQQIGAMNWLVWIRGATGVIWGNTFSDIAGSYWGAKSELRFSIRGAEDVRPQGSCANVSYPVPRQLGQNHNGTNYFTDPIYIWGNTGAQEIGAGWGWGNPCGLNFIDFFKEGRDYIVGTPKPGYQPYTYPHPLLSGIAPPPTTISHPADTNADYLMSLNEATFFGACWKKAPDISGGCPVNATLDYAVRAGTLWNATATGLYKYNSSQNCPLCWEVAP